MLSEMKMKTEVRFGRFRLDTRSGRLESDGRTMMLPEKSLLILLALLEQPSDLVTREELRQRLWPSGTFVDFEDGLNHAVQHLREALGDRAEEPRFIETVRRRGYRFIGHADVMHVPAGFAAIRPDPPPAPDGIQERLVALSALPVPAGASADPVSCHQLGRPCPLMAEQSVQEDALDLLSGLNTELERLHDHLDAARCQLKRILVHERVEDSCPDLCEGGCARLIHMEAGLAERVVGQDEAIHLLADAVRRSCAGLGDPRRPIGSFLLLGPGGVGKAEVARALAECLFGDGEALFHLDPSNWTEHRSVVRLIGMTFRDAGRSLEGRMLHADLRRPRGVVLARQMEGAHPEVLNVLLRIIRDGFVPDGSGSAVDFRDTVVILTSGVVSNHLRGPALRHGGGGEPDREGLAAALRHTFPAELLEEMDEIVMFRPLGKVDLVRIMDLHLRSLERRLAERMLTIELTDRARERLAERSYDALCGARRLRSTIQRMIETPLAAKILAGHFSEGDEILVEATGATLTFRRRRSAQLAAVSSPANRA